MAKVTVKYKCGERVSYGNLPGMVTAVTIRGKGRAYEFSYIDHNGAPACNTVEDFELAKFGPKPIGFKG